jgi:hypothetical protein
MVRFDGVDVRRVGESEGFEIGDVTMGRSMWDAGAGRCGDVGKVTF